MRVLGHISITRMLIEENNDEYQCCSELFRKVPLIDTVHERTPRVPSSLTVRLQNRRVREKKWNFKWKSIYRLWRPKISRMIIRSNPLGYHQSIFSLQKTCYFEMRERDIQFKGLLGRWIKFWKLFQDPTLFTFSISITHAEVLLKNNRRFRKQRAKSKSEVP